jgi:hypothetical protein
MSLLTKKLLLAAVWCGAMWVLWAPGSVFDGFSVGRDGKTVQLGLVGWYRVSVGRSRPYAEGVLLDGVVLGIGATILITGIVLLSYRRHAKHGT